PNASGVISFGTRTGNFHVSAPDSVLNLADSYVSDALNFKGQSAFSVFKLNNATYQDLVTAEITSAVPEPETFALFLGGLGAIGLLARRRTVR
ncbi:PEP-CTERM sorting domain-containing protein, partial [Klebsiella variicola]|uniref:PEP-CTERM sorting domain-containing protein n=1 Tax=Klebsiella variicola TaxID=244366 RepID=UPI00272FC2FE